MLLLLSYLDEKMRKENSNNDDDDGASDGDGNNQLKTKHFNLLHLRFPPYSYFLHPL